MNYDVIDLEVAEESATNSYDEYVAMEARIKDRTVGWYENKEVLETKIVTFIKESKKQYKNADYAQATDSLDQAKKACEDLDKHTDELTMDEYCAMTKSKVERPKALDRYKNSVHSEIESRIKEIDKLIKKVAKKVDKQSATEGAMDAAMLAYLAAYGLNEAGEEINPEAYEDAMESVITARASFRNAVDEFDFDDGEQECP